MSDLRSVTLILLDGMDNNVARMPPHVFSSSSSADPVFLTEHPSEGMASPENTALH